MTSTSRQTIHGVVELRTIGTFTIRCGKITRTVSWDANTKFTVKGDETSWDHPAFIHGSLVMIQVWDFNRATKITSVKRPHITLGSGLDAPA